MRISKLIEKLIALKEKHGDLPVFCVEGNYDWEVFPVGEEETGVLTATECSPLHGLNEGCNYIMIYGSDNWGDKN